MPEVAHGGGNPDNSIAGVIDSGSGNLASRQIRDATGGNEVLVVDISSSPYDFHLMDDATNNDAQDAHSSTSGHGNSLPTLDIDDEARNTGSGKVANGADTFAATGGRAVRRIIFIG